jgi:hypothetical protein
LQLIIHQDLSMNALKFVTAISVSLLLLLALVLRIAVSSSAALVLYFYRRLHRPRLASPTVLSQATFHYP